MCADKPSESPNQLLLFYFALTRNNTLRKQSLCLVLLDHRQLSSGEIKTNFYKKEHILKRAAQAIRPSAMRKQK